jgi:hypothetical protein
MGHNDYDFDEHPQLPPEAGKQTSQGFELDDEWFAKAEPELRKEAMRAWFLSRFCDPANDTPYNSEEGGYLYIHGGPFEADDQISSRFGDLASENEIQEVVEDVESDGIYEWAPVHHEYDDYDEQFALALEQKDEPLTRLKERLAQSQQILTLQGNADAMNLAQKLVFSSAIGALEAYLYEVAYFWVDTHADALQSLVEGLPEFREQKIPLSELFKRHAGIKNHAKGYLQNLVWHRWKKVASVFRHALSVELPSTAAFEGPLLKRHDIVHRSGHDKDGAPVTVTAAEIADLCAVIREFADELNSRIEAKGKPQVVDAKSIDGPAPEF